MSQSAPEIDPALAPTMYVTSWCGYCRRLRTHLTDAGVPFETVDIEEDPEAASFVESVNGGDQVVPTVRFTDGSTATNPSVSEVIAHLTR